MTKAECSETKIGNCDLHWRVTCRGQRQAKENIYLRTYLMELVSSCRPTSTEGNSRRELRQSQNTHSLTHSSIRLSPLVIRTMNANPCTPALRPYISIYLSLFVP